jgi:YD repeat-containing protein
VSYTIYNDTSHEVRVYSGWHSLGGGLYATTGPITVTRWDPARGYTEVLTMHHASIASSNGKPDGQESLTGLESLTRGFVDTQGRPTDTHRYFDLPASYSTGAMGDLGAHFYGYGQHTEAISQQATVSSGPGVSQVDTFTPSNVEVGDVFTLTAVSADGETWASVSYTATAATGANVVSGLVAAWNASTDALHTPVTAASASGGSALTLTGDVANTAFVAFATAWNRSGLVYDDLGRLVRSESLTGTVERTVYDAAGRALSTWVGTNDTGATAADPDGSGGANNMVAVTHLEYDGGGVGDGNLTKLTEHPGGSAADRVTQMWYDWRDRLVALKQGVQSGESSGDAAQRQISYLEYDNLDEVTATEQYDGDAVTISDSNGDGVPDKPASLFRRGRMEFAYDEQGRVYQTRVFSVNQSSGALSSTSLKSDTWYDKRGNVIKQTRPGAPAVKYRYDGAGRNTAVFLTDAGSDVSWTHAGELGQDLVYEQREFYYDKNGNTLFSLARLRFHSDTGGWEELGTPTSGGAVARARVYATKSTYDAADRLTGSVDLGAVPGGRATSGSSAHGDGRRLLQRLDHPDHRRGRGGQGGDGHGLHGSDADLQLRQHRREPRQHVEVRAVQGVRRLEHVIRLRRRGAPGQRHRPAGHRGQDRVRRPGAGEQDHRGMGGRHTQRRR